MTNGGPLNTTRNVVMLIFQNFYQRTERVGYATSIAMLSHGRPSGIRFCSSTTITSTGV